MRNGSDRARPKAFEDFSALSRPVSFPGRDPTGTSPWRTECDTACGPVIVTDRVIHKELEKLLGPDDPPIQSVMRDLGIDHSAGRRRRIATLQQRFKKNKQRRIKLRSLKLPNMSTRLRLHRGGVQPVAFWGFEGLSLIHI